MTAESESSTASGNPPLPGARWALTLGCFLLAGFFAVVVCGWIDRERRGRLETVDQMTAVEDRIFYTIPADAVAGAAPAVQFSKQPLFLTAAPMVGIHDSDVRRVATDLATGLTIYSTEDSKVIPAKEHGNTYLLKVGIGRYVKVRGK